MYFTRYVSTFVFLRFWNSVLWKEHWFHLNNLPHKNVEIMGKGLTMLVFYKGCNTCTYAMTLRTRNKISPCNILLLTLCPQNMWTKSADSLWWGRCGCIRLAERYIQKLPWIALLYPFSSFFLPPPFGNELRQLCILWLLKTYLKQSYRGSWLSSVALSVKFL